MGSGDVDPTKIYEIIAQLKTTSKSLEAHDAQLAIINFRLDNHDERITRLEKAKARESGTVTSSDDLLGTSPAAVIAAPGDGLLGAALAAKSHRTTVEGVVPKPVVVPLAPATILPELATATEILPITAVVAPRPATLLLVLAMAITVMSELVTVLPWLSQPVWC